MRSRLEWLIRPDTTGHQGGLKRLLSPWGLGNAPIRVDGPHSLTDSTGYIIYASGVGVLLYPKFTFQLHLQPTTAFRYLTALSPSLLHHNNVTYSSSCYHSPLHRRRSSSYAQSHSITLGLIGLVAREYFIHLLSISRRHARPTRRSSSKLTLPLFSCLSLLLPSIISNRPVGLRLTPRPTPRSSSGQRAMSDSTAST